MRMKMSATAQKNRLLITEELNQELLREMDSVYNLRQGFLFIIRKRRQSSQYLRIKENSSRNKISRP